MNLTRRLKVLPDATKQHLSRRSHDNEKALRNSLSKSKPEPLPQKGSGSDMFNNMWRNSPEIAIFAENSGLWLNFFV